MSQNGRTIMVTIHQPNTEIFEAFDALLLMQRGGKVRALRPCHPPRPPIPIKSTCPCKRKSLDKSKVCLPSITACVVRVLSSNQHRERFSWRHEMGRLSNPGTRSLALAKLRKKLLPRSVKFRGVR